MGSKRHLLDQMFNTKSRALYQSAELFPLHPIETEHYVSWIQALYTKAGKQVPQDTVIEKALTHCNNYPIYVQQYFYYRNYSA
jgi:hypothetical protein